MEKEIRGKLVDQNKMTCMKSRELCSVIVEVIEVNFTSASDFATETYCFRWKSSESF